jgi:hypothetical protein
VRLSSGGAGETPLCCASHVEREPEPASRREEVPSEQFVSDSDKSPIVSPEHATELLGTMQGGYNIQTLVELLDSPNLVLLLLMTLLMFEAFYDGEKRAQNGCEFTKFPKPTAQRTSRIF